MGRLLQGHTENTETTPVTIKSHVDISRYLLIATPVWVMISPCAPFPPTP